MRCHSWIAAGLVLVGGCLFADWAFTRWVVLRSDTTDSGRIERLYLVNSNEIPVFGTSKVHSLDLGPNAFNYSMDGAQFALTDVFLQIELAKPKTSPLVVEMEFQDTGTLGEVGKLIPFATDARFATVLSRSHSWSWRYRIPGIRYFGYYDLFFKNYLAERGNITRVSRGAVQFWHAPAFDPADFAAAVRERLQMTNGLLLDDRIKQTLIRQISEHPQRLFFLVATPVHSSGYAHFVNEDKLKEYEARLAALPNVVVVDWSRLPYADQDFIDTIHLRQAPFAELSRKLREKMRQELRARGQPNWADLVGN